MGRADFHTCLHHSRVKMGTEPKVANVADPQFFETHPRPGYAQTDVAASEVQPWSQATGIEWSKSRLGQVRERVWGENLETRARVVKESCVERKALVLWVIHFINNCWAPALGQALYSWWSDWWTKASPCLQMKWGNFQERTIPCVIYSPSWCEERQWKEVNTNRKI